MTCADPGSQEDRAAPELLTPPDTKQTWYGAGLRDGMTSKTEPWLPLSGHLPLALEAHTALSSCSAGETWTDVNTAGLSRGAVMFQS